MNFILNSDLENSLSFDKMLSEISRLKRNTEKIIKILSALKKPSGEEKSEPDNLQT